MFTFKASRHTKKPSLTWKVLIKTFKMSLFTLNYRSWFSTFIIYLTLIALTPFQIPFSKEKSNISAGSKTCTSYTRSKCWWSNWAHCNDNWLRTERYGVWSLAWAKSLTSEFTLINHYYAMIISVRIDCSVETWL